MEKKTEDSVYVRQQGKDCVVQHDGARHVVKDCDANKLANTLWDRLGPKYTSHEMYTLGFVPESYQKQKHRYV